MRKILFTLAMAAIPALALAQDEKPSSPLLFDSYEWDFGTIEEVDGIVTHVFQFTNISKEPVQIVSISTSCGCTNAEFSTEPVAPGDFGEITVHFSPARTEGVVFREVEVFTRDRKSYDHLSLMADVIPMPMGLEQLNPHQLSGDIRTNVNRCNFGYIAQGKTVTKKVSLVNIGSKTAKIQFTTTGKANGMTVSMPSELGPEESAYVDVTYTIPVGNRYYGMARDTIWIKADGQPSGQPIIVSALRIEDLEGTENKPHPSLRVEPGYVDFGSKAPGKTYKQTITIGNTGNADLIFRDVEKGPGTTININDGLVIKPGQEKKVTVSIVNSKEAGTTTMGSINLTTNDPVRPFRELRLQIDTK